MMLMAERHGLRRRMDVRAGIIVGAREPDDAHETSCRERESAGDEDPHPRICRTREYLGHGSDPQEIRTLTRGLPNKFLGLHASSRNNAAKPALPPATRQTADL